MNVESDLELEVSGRNGMKETQRDETYLARMNREI